jgi:transposase-like protein
MRYAAAEKLEIIRLVEQSSLSVRRTLAQLGIPRSTFYCWYDRYRAGHAEGLEDRTPAEGVGNFVFVSHTKKPVRAGGRYGGEQGRRNRG